MSTTIGLVSESLRNLLDTGLSGTALVTLLSPADSTSNQKRVNLFLYRAAPNPQLVNRDWVPGPGNVVSAPPLAFDLYYLLTAYAPDDPQTGLADMHGLLGEAIRVLHDNPVIPDAELAPGLRSGQVKVTPMPLDEEALTKVWTALNKEFRLSMVFLASFVEVASVHQQPIARRVADFRLDVDANAARPVIHDMTPPGGPIMTTLTFTGTGLLGWRVTVWVGGETVLDAAPIDEPTTFTAVVPVDLDPGVHLVEVDVAHLTTFSTTFEVTAP